VTDRDADKNDNAPESIWAADGVELFVGGENPDQDGALIFSDRQLLMAASATPKFFFGHQPQGTDGNCQLFVQPNVDGKGYTLEAAIPFKALGIEPKLAR